MSSTPSGLLGLIKTNRLRKTAKENGNVLIASESDKGRVINSSAFRRLQQKAQVFPLDENASVRTRLTHSLEVSQVGRHLAHKIIEHLDLQRYAKYDALAAFVNTVESSCLLHDIGNPPFGHLGEVAIRNWASGIIAKWGYDDDFNGKELNYFDGNPQGLRFSTFLGGIDDYGLNLTASLILSSIKYPYSFRDNPSVNKNKFGLFDHERRAYLNACRTVGWTAGRVFPLALLMEAADDISYCTSDLEDGLEKGLISEQEMCDEFPEYNKVRGASDVITPFIKFKTRLASKAVAEAADCFVENIDDILAGNCNSIIKRSGEVGEKIKTINNIVVSNIYTNDAVEKIEIAGKSAITGILCHFDNILDMRYDDFNKLRNRDVDFIRGNSLEFDYRVFKRLPKSYVDKYCAMCEEGSEKSERQARLHLVVDFLAGMTDSFAVYLYQILSGIKMR